MQLLSMILLRIRRKARSKVRTSKGTKLFSLRWYLVLYLSVPLFPRDLQCLFVFRT